MTAMFDGAPASVPTLPPTNPYYPFNPYYKQSVVHCSNAPVLRQDYDADP